MLERVPDLWLSRSWTTRPRRAGESADAYVFVDDKTFRDRLAAGGFIEHVEFPWGQLSGTPTLEPPEGRDALLEIELHGAKQVRQRHPDAVLVFVVPPSPEAQAARLRARGDPEDQVTRRVEFGRREVEEGRRIADHVVVNDDLDRAVDEVAGIVAAHRRRRAERSQQEK